MVFAILGKLLIEEFIYVVLKMFSCTCSVVSYCGCSASKEKGCAWEWERVAWEGCDTWRQQSGEDVGGLQLLELSLSSYLTGLGNDAGQNSQLNIVFISNLCHIPNYYFTRLLHFLKFTISNTSAVVHCSITVMPKVREGGVGRFSSFHFLRTTKHSTPL